CAAQTSRSHNGYQTRAGDCWWLCIIDDYVLLTCGAVAAAVSCSPGNRVGADRENRRPIVSDCDWAAVVRNRRGAQVDISRAAQPGRGDNGHQRRTRNLRRLSIIDNYRLQANGRIAMSICRCPKDRVCSDWKYGGRIV